MRPYLAIISDSFSAAFASRLLWIVLGSIAIFLLALAPIGYYEVYTVEFTRSDIRSPDRLTGLLAEALADPSPTAARNVATALPEELREAVRARAAGEGRGPGRRWYVEAFNALLDSDRQWYRAELWEKTPRLRELRQLDERAADEMDERLVRRRARLRLETAFPGAFRPRPERSVALSYAGAETPAVLPFGRQRFIDVLNQFVFPLALYYLLGVGAVFVGVLVTAPIIPEMLQPGSLHLLLSKPISRSALYLSKFVGGCAFVLLSVTMLVVGLWLIAGFRLGLWNHRLLYCIPVFVFLFAVYYSVSALAALRWRSAIVAVVVTVLFWFVCFAVGMTGGLFDSFVSGPDRVERLAVMDDFYFVATASGELLRLGSADTAYDAISDSQFTNRFTMLGPVRLADGRIAAARVPQNQFNMFGSEDVELMLLDSAASGAPQPGLRLPPGTSRLRAAVDGGLFATASGGIFYASADSLLVDEQDEDAVPAEPGLLGGIRRLLGHSARGFTRVAPESVTLTPPVAFATISGSDAVIAYSRGRLMRLERSGSAGAWSIAAERETEGDIGLDAQVAATATHVVLARDDEPLRIFTADELEKVDEVPFPDSVSVVALHAAPTAGLFAIELSDRRVALLHLDPEPRLVIPDFPYQDHIEAVAWAADGSLRMAHHIDRLVAIDVTSGEIVDQRRPERGLWRLVEAWVVTPLRYTLPQTGEISETITAIICGRQDLQIPTGGQPQREQLDVVRPLATCGAFTVVMLLLGCLYIHREDF